MRQTLKIDGILCEIVKIEILQCWKLQNYHVTQILREIKVGKSRVSKSAILILAYFEALNSNFL